MLFYRTIDKKTLELLRSLDQKGFLKEFYLAGGTALALQIGHRKSIDLDFFISQEFDTESLFFSLKKLYKTEIIIKTAGSLTAIINDVNVSFIKYDYPLLNPIIRTDDINVISIKDIGAMKLSAIANRGAKKDFYDIYFLIKKVGLEGLFECFDKKFNQSQHFQALKSLTYFADADEEPNPVLIKKVGWNNVKDFIKKSVREL